MSAISARGGSARAGIVMARPREDAAHRSTSVERDGEATARRTGRAVERVVDRAVRARVVGVNVVAVRDVAIVVGRRVKATRRRAEDGARARRKGALRVLQTMTSISERDRDDATNHRTREIKQQREQISVGVLEFHADDVEVRLARD